MYDTAGVTSLSSSQVPPKEIGEEVVVLGSWGSINRVSKKGWLDTQWRIWSAEVDSSHLRSLDASSQLRCGLSLSICSLAEPKACLNTRADSISIAIVDPSTNEGANTILAVLVKLESPSEGSAKAIRPISYLCCKPKLRLDLTISINSCSKTRSETKVAVAPEDTTCSSNSTNSTNTSGCQSVLHLMVGVCLGRGSEETR